MVNCVIIPESPALIPELSPNDSASGELRAAALKVIGDFAAQASTIAIVGSRDAKWYTAHTGSFRAWGAPGVTVSGGHYLSELVARYLLEQSDSARGKHVSTHASLAEALTAFDSDDEPALVIVVLDGSAGLTARAPLALIETAAEADAWCQALLSGGTVATSADVADYANFAETVDAVDTVDTVDPVDTVSDTASWLEAAGVIEPVLWLELASLQPQQCELHAADTTLGVGRYVATCFIEARKVRRL